MRTPLSTLITSLVSATALFTACTGGQAAGDPVPERLRTEVLQTLPHDPGAFTQGLEMSGGTLYEGTGLAGASSLRAGPPGAAPAVSTALPSPLFGEGITVVGASVWQLTWRDGIAIRRDAVTLAEQQRVGYRGEGWGLCHQPGRGRLVMSDGSSQLTYRDAATFAPLAKVTVRESGREVDRLNELECVGDTVYANVWETDRILRIDAVTGDVTATVDAAGLLNERERERADVLNGIAAVPGTDEFLVTGKLWPTMFRVRLVPTG